MSRRRPVLGHDRELVQRARQLFQERYRLPPKLVAVAPGRLELLGNHTDYNQGLVLSVGIDRCVAMAVGPRRDGQIQLESSAFEPGARFYIDDFNKMEGPGAWMNYVKGVLWRLRKQGVRFMGFNALAHSNLPIGAGMSSSAALEVATALAVRQLYPFSYQESGLRMNPIDKRDQPPPLTKRDRFGLARACCDAENEFVGVRCGWLDQISSLFAKEDHAVGLDCLHGTVEWHPLIPGLVLAVCDTGIRHDLTSGSYNELHQHCMAAAEKLGLASLRLADLAILNGKRSGLNEREFECARHVITENRRVVAAERAMRAGDASQLGEYLFQSHASSKDYLRNSVKELDTLVELARGQTSCLGARLTGGGFGGATINLVSHARAPEFLAEMERGYREATGRAMTGRVCGVKGLARVFQ